MVIASVFSARAAEGLSEPSFNVSRYSVIQSSSDRFGVEAGAVDTVVGTEDLDGFDEPDAAIALRP